MLQTLNTDFIHSGFRYLTPNTYLTKENSSSLHDLKKLFDEELEEDGYAFRKRAYLKLEWNKTQGEISISDNQAYFQTSLSNTVDGGKIRQFKVMNFKVMAIPLIKTIIQQNMQMVLNYEPLKMEPGLVIGLHFIRYQVEENGASYSSPDWLHKDDEPLVFIHLIHLSKTALGGDNLIADTDTMKIRHVIKLENDIDTLVLNKNVYHAVTPLGSRQGVAARDVILFTIEPQHTQQVAAAGARV